MVKKKAMMPASRKRAQKQPKAKKSSTRPTRKARVQSELTQAVARLEAIAEKLAETAELLSETVRHGSGAQPLPAAEVMHSQVDEHADDVEVATTAREE